MKMKSNNVLLIALLLMITLVLITGAGCTSFINPQGGNYKSEFTVEVRDYAFKPDQLVIKTGDTVTWVNIGEHVHTATSDNGTEIASIEIDPDTSYSHTFDMPGEYAYHCSFYSFMKGTIIVQ